MIKEIDGQINLGACQLKRIWLAVIGFEMPLIYSSYIQNNAAQDQPLTGFLNKVNAK
jgi:hypothetical protein